MPEGLVERDGVRLHYREWPADATRSLLLLPGLGGGGGSSLYWVPFVEAIGKRLRIVSMEQRGHAHSDWSESYRWQEVVADINAVVTKLDLAPAILVGHSAGSAWAYLYASEHPDNVDRLVDVDGGAPYPLVDAPPQPPILRTQAQFMELARTRWSSASVEKETLEWIKDGTMQLDDGRWTWRQDPRVWTALFRGEMCAAPEEFLDHARRVSCPVLIVRGADSDFFPRLKADQLAAVVPDARIVEVARAGHVVHLANPSGFYDAVAQFIGLD